MFPFQDALVGRTALILGGVIAVCGVIGLFTRGALRQNYWRRYVTMVVLTVVVMVPSAVGGWPLAVLLALLSLLASAELWGLRISTSLDWLVSAGGPRWFHATGVLAAVAVPAVATLLGADALARATAVALAVTGLPVFFARDGASRRQLAWVAFGVVYIAATIGALGALRHREGFGPLLFVLVAVQFADLGAFMLGRLLGRRALAPHLSPGKTWEGLAGGCALAIVGALSFRYAVPTLTWGQAALAGAVLCIQSVLGDLFASFVKRTRGLKDFGSILPGHGGVIDRFDGYFFCAPLALALFAFTSDALTLALAIAAVVATASLVGFVWAASRFLVRTGRGRQQG